jgi:transcriptional regulator with XRE-family HTH domain
MVSNNQPASSGRRVSIGKILAGIRRTKRIKQLDLARMTGILQPGLSRIEKGLVEPRVKTLNLICNALGIAVADIFSDRVLEQIRPEYLPDGVSFRKSLLVSIPLVEVGDASLELDVEGLPKISGSMMIQLPTNNGLAEKSPMALKVFGDAMKSDHGPESFEDGDIVVVERSEADSGQFALVWTKEAPMLRQVFIDEDSIRLIPLNRRYAEHKIPRSEVRAVWRVAAHVRYFTGHGRRVANKGR